MPRRSPKLIVAAHRAAQGRRIVAEQRALIARLAASELPTDEAETALRTYIALLENLEDREERLRAEARAKRGGFRKPLL
jgi:hypothetical protein